MNARLGTRWPLAVLVIVAMAAMATAGRGQEPENRWAAGVFGIPGVDWRVHDLEPWDNGDELAVYVAGEFSIAGRVHASGVARWDGREWSSLGSGIADERGDADVRALAVFDDGSGAALYAAGQFGEAGGRAASNVARWDGTRWSPVGAGLGGWRDSVDTLAVYDDGNGPALYAGVTLRPEGGPELGMIARWDGRTWSTTASTDRWGVTMLRAIDLPDGPRLFAGGRFTAIDGVAASGIAVWDGDRWRPMGVGFDHAVHDIVVFDDGQGWTLFACGSFESSGSTPVFGLARWTRDRWLPVGGFVGYSIGDLHVHDDGAGPALYVSGWSFTVDGQRFPKLARWDGREWSSAPGLTEGSTAADMITIDGDGGKTLVAGGTMGLERTGTAAHVASWNGRDWHTLGRELGGDRIVYALESHDDGTGDALYASGNFSIRGEPDVWRVACWDGQDWSAVGADLAEGHQSCVVYALRSATVAGEHGLFAGGDFSIDTGSVANGIARWDGREWSPLSLGVTGDRSTYVLDMLPLDNGAGGSLVVAGAFSHAGGLPAANIAVWDGAAWSDVGGGMNDTVTSLAIYDDGRGPALYAGGLFTRAGETEARSIARWDGVAWEPVGGGVGYWIRTLVTADVGDGPALYAGGSFTSAGAQTAVGVARWDGHRWTPVGPGLFGWVYDLAAIEIDGRTQIVAAGSFNTDREKDLRGIARWDGNAWHPFDRGLEHLSAIDRPVGRAIQTFNDGSGPALFVGGDFTFAGGHVSPGLARWSLACTADIDGDGSLTVFDFLAFLTLFDAADPAADFDGDGEFTIFDFLAFQTAFDAGCG